MYGALTKEMRSVDLLLPRPEAPFPGLNYKGLVQKVQSFTVPWWTSPSSGYSSNFCHSCANSSFEALFGTLNDSIQGLDLHSFIP